jgi:hypothetical protein
VFTLLFLPFKLLKWFHKLSGVRGGLLLAIGIGVGMLVAPERGAVLRARLRARIDEARLGVVPEAIDPVV